MILSDAFRLVGAGMLLGALGLLFAVEAVRHFLYGVSGFDPLTLVIAGVLLTGVALIAAFIPAIRAASIDPIQALRMD
jgi:ABC-type antimicrobial peptide transport system permease subunit